MSSQGKNYRKALDLVEKNKLYNVEEALDLIPKIKTAKFDETVEVAVLLNVDPKQSDQNVRGVVTLPRGTGKTVKILVLTKGEKEKEAQGAGADYIGADELIDKIKDGWIDFDVVIATPDMMASVGKVAKILGPRGLMPNPKTGTVTIEIEKTVKDFKAGKIEFRVDKSGNIHAPIGKISFSKEALFENLEALVDAILKARPASVKGSYVKKFFITTTMGPSIKLDTSKVLALVK